VAEPRGEAGAVLRGEKVLVTGPASQVGLPVVRALLQENQVHGLARFGRAEDRERLEALGVHCIALDLAKDGFDGVPDDFDVVLHFAVVKSGDFGYDLAANAEGTGRLMAHCRRARAFLHCSTAGVYQHAGAGHPVKEDDPLGDNHHEIMPTYSICKIAGETVARFAARHWNLPTSIARLSVPYGDNGGWPWFHLLMMRAGSGIPLHPERPNLFNPIHEDDFIAHLPRLLEVAAVPPTVVNWGGSEPASIEEWCAWMGELTGLEAKFETSERTVGPLPVDLTRMHQLLGPTRVPWREGIRRMIEARAPELLR
jgi:nucleoside-diphosphate-sugar epimerase